MPADRHACLVVVTVAHIDSLLIQGVGGFAVDFRGRDIRIGIRPTLRQLAAGVDMTIEQIGNGFAARLTGQPHVEDGLHRVRPRAFYGTAAQQNDHRVGVGADHCLNHPQVTDGELHIIPVKALGLITVGKSRENNGNLRLFRCPPRLIQQHVRRIAPVVAAGRIDGIRQEVQRLGKPCRVDVAGACTLIAQILRHGANDGDFCALL